jgi:hypothetical protein
MDSNITAAKSILSQLDVDGIEWHYGASLIARPILESDLVYLKKLKLNSIHSLRVVPDSIAEALSLFEKIQSDYDKINAHSIVIHPESLPPRRVLDKLHMNFLTENMNCLPFCRSRLGFEDVLKKNRDFGLCLDVSHAFYWSPRETKRIVQNWGRRIEQIHFSFARNGLDHLHSSYSTKTFLDSIKPLADLNVPIVIEEVLPVCTVESARDEISKVKEILFEL